MKVYLVLYIGAKTSGENACVGVFSTEEKAKSALKKHMLSHFKGSKNFSAEETMLHWYTIKTFEVDSEEILESLSLNYVS